MRVRVRVKRRVRFRVRVRVRVRVRARVRVGVRLSTGWSAHPSLCGTCRGGYCLERSRRCPPPQQQAV